MTPFSNWLRALPGCLSSLYYDNENLDYVWFQYRQAWFITIEEKRFMGVCTSAQEDTHGVIAQLLTIASGSVVKTMRGKRAIEYRGHYVVRFCQTMPDDSALIMVNDEEITKDGLLQLLATGHPPL